MKGQIAVAALLIACCGGLTYSAEQVDRYPSETTYSAEYSVWGDAGELMLTGEPGAPFEAWDAQGACVARGVLDAPALSLVVPNAGPDQFGNYLYVAFGGENFGLGGEVYSTDPDWEW